MRDFFEFADIESTSFIDLSDNEIRLSDEARLSELLVEAADADRDIDELGGFILSPAAAAAAVELPHHKELHSKYRGMYIRYSSSCPNQHWGTEATVHATIDMAYHWWIRGKTPTMLIGDISARNFALTKCHSAHKTGTHVDIDLARTLPKDPGYGREAQEKCAQVCWLAIQLGFGRGLFSDQEVCYAVNKYAAERGFPGRMVVRADHDDHFHFEMPLV